MFTVVGTGNCSLPSVHGALYTGVQAADGELAPFLRGIFSLFHDSPGRRSKYTRTTGRKFSFSLAFLCNALNGGFIVVERALYV